MGKKGALCVGIVFLLLLGVGIVFSPESVTNETPSPTATLPPAGALSGWVICVDAGHGGYDGGAQARDSGVLEKEINLQVAKRLAAALKKEGARVILTRAKDEALAGPGEMRKRRDLQARVEAAVGADVFLSIHMNEYRSRAESGPQVFYRAGQEKSRLLAGALQAAMIAQLQPEKERAAHEGEFYLLEHLQIPAVLVECGFISNAAEEQMLLDAGYQERLAAAICAGVREYARLMGK